MQFVPLLIGGAVIGAVVSRPATGHKAQGQFSDGSGEPVSKEILTGTTRRPGKDVHKPRVTHRKAGVAMKKFIRTRGKKTGSRNRQDGTDLSKLGVSYVPVFFPGLDKTKNHRPLNEQTPDMFIHLVENGDVHALDQFVHEHEGESQSRIIFR